MDTKEGEGRNLTCGDRNAGDCKMEKLAVAGYAGESGKLPGRLRIDLAEAVFCSAARVGEAMLFLKIDGVAILLL